MTHPADRFQPRAMTTATDPATISVETFAEWLAHFVFFRPRSLEAVERLGVPGDDFESARSRWELSMREDIADEKLERVTAFGQRFAEVRKRLQTERPAIESLGPRLPIASVDAPAAADGARLVAPPEVQAPSVASGAEILDTPASAPVVVVPSYLRAPPTPLDASALPGSPLPATVEPQPSDGSETVLLPSPAGLAAILAAKSDALPFSEEPDPAFVAALQQPADPDEGDEAGGFTEEMPVPAELAKMVASAQPFARKSATSKQVAPTLSLEQYAALRAALVVHGETDEPTLRGFGVRDLAAKEALQAEYFRRFKEEPGLRDQFQALLGAAIARARGR